MNMNFFGSTSTKENKGRDRVMLCSNEELEEFSSSNDFPANLVFFGFVCDGTLLLKAVNNMQRVIDVTFVNFKVFNTHGAVDSFKSLSLIKNVTFFDCDAGHLTGFRELATLFFKLQLSVYAFKFCKLGTVIESWMSKEIFESNSMEHLSFTGCGLKSTDIIYLELIGNISGHLKGLWVEYDGKVHGREELRELALAIRNSLHDKVAEQKDKE